MLETDWKCEVMCDDFDQVEKFHRAFVDLLNQKEFVTVMDADGLVQRYCGSYRLYGVTPMHWMNSSLNWEDRSTIGWVYDPLVQVKRKRIRLYWTIYLADPIRLTECCIEAAKYDYDLALKSKNDVLSSWYQSERKPERGTLDGVCIRYD